MISRLITAWKTRHLTPVPPQERVEVAGSARRWRADVASGAVAVSLLLVLGSVATCAVVHPRVSDDRPVLR